jgi:SmpA / OmlA family
MRETVLVALVSACVVMFSACSSNDGGDNDQPRSVTAAEFQQVRVGMTKREVQSLLGAPARVRMIQNHHPFEPDIRVETVYEGWDYSAEGGSNYHLIFFTNDRVG